MALEFFNNSVRPNLKSKIQLTNQNSKICVGIESEKKIVSNGHENIPEVLEYYLDRQNWRF